ncbi:MAG: hypothetical protein IKH44_15570 [Bacteroidales bacterium]|nr:hypothetical protein [Bacteroidales bacterium]MBR4536249.1 hypothetical protein [Bacteroidales bacterium]
MKKTILTLVAFMLVMGMTQCKKEQTTTNVNPADDGETVYITMKVADGGGKHIVYPGTGAVVYGDGDKIYVGNNGHYVGTLTYANGAFSGYISNPSTTDYLHFYFMGGKTPATAPTAGSTTSFTVDISDQSSKLPVLSYGHSNTKYIDGTTAYTCMLENKCGLVKFVPTTPNSSTISISGMKTTATINFASGNEGIDPVDAAGTVTLYSVSDTEKWAILLPQGEVVSPTVNVGNYACTMTSTITTIPEVTTNMYHTTGIRVRVPGQFRVRLSEEKKVYFSPGNLQYIGSAATPYWKFADNQLEYLGDSQNEQGEDPNIDRDRFGWGTSGWNNGNLYYQPYNRNYNTENESRGYGPTDGNGNYWLSLTGDYVNADWGVYNPISNGGNQAGLWRTPTEGEWRGLVSNNSWGLSQVDGLNGLIVLPIDWVLPDGLNFTPGATSSYSTNIYDSDQWALMEANGAIFLYAYSYSTLWSNWYGMYWSASHYNSRRDNANYMNITSYEASVNSGYRNNAYCVRLIQDVE